jgi:hypothetical protein
MYGSALLHRNKPLGSCPLQTVRGKSSPGDGLPLLTTNKVTSDRSETKNSLKLNHGSFFVKGNL